MPKFIDAIFTEGKKHIWDHPHVLDYLSSRGVSEEQIRSLELGYIPEGKWPPYIDPAKADADEAQYLRQSGKGVKLRGKLLFPMTNAVGIKQGFQVRSPSVDTKDYWKYHSTRADIDGIFFGTKVAMEAILDTQEVYLVEGIFDLFPVQRVKPNTISCCTSKVSETQLTFLKRYVKRVHVMFDQDKQGQDFFTKFLKFHRKEFDLIEKVQYGGKDPSESWMRLGEEAFRAQF